MLFTWIKSKPTNRRLMSRLTMNSAPIKNDTLPAMDTKPTPSGHILVMTRDEIDQLGDILDNPFIPLNDLQKALFMRGYRLVRI